jgi:hypothetical protein
MSEKAIRLTEYLLRLATLRTSHNGCVVGMMQ